MPSCQLKRQYVTFCESFHFKFCVIYKLRITSYKNSDVQFVNYTNIGSDGIDSR